MLDPPRQPQIEQQHMRRVTPDVSDCAREIACLGDHLDTGLAVQQQTQVAPNLALVVREHDLDV
jgi:hypothetical protein